MSVDRINDWKPSEWTTERERELREDMQRAEAWAKVYLVLAVIVVVVSLAVAIVGGAGG